MTSYLILLYNNFGVNLWLTVLLFIIGCLAIIFIIFMSFILILDSLYRPNYPQYPFNFFLDRVIPFTALFFPTIIIFLLHPFETWFARLVLLILVHTLVLAPMFHYWAKLRCWYSHNDIIAYNSWNHPRLYENIALALIYPLLWGIYFSLFRFLRLGTTYNVWDYIKNLPTDFIVIVFILPYVVCWFVIILVHISQIRSYLWNQCVTLLYSSHIYLLKYYIYFRFMEWLYKASFVVIHVLTLTVAYKNQGPWWRRMTNYLYYNPKWMTFLMFSIIIFEIIWTKKLYYGLYLLFIYTIIYRCLTCFFAYQNTNFVFDCCLSDYFFLTDVKLNLRYPQQFWMYFQDAEFYFGIEYQYTQEELEKFTEEMNKPKVKWLLRKKVFQNLHHQQVNIRIQKRVHASFSLRMSAEYLASNHVRWVHTERIVNTAVKYHSCTGLFVKSIFDQIVLLNSNWKHLHHMQAAKIITPAVSDLYRPFTEKLPSHKKHFIGIQEQNLPSNFGPLIQKGVIVEPYDQTNPKHNPVYYCQKNPDTLFDFEKSEFIDKRIHALDQKTNNPGLGQNKMLSEITPQRYNSTIDRLKKTLKLDNYLTTEMNNVLELLVTNCQDFEKHQLIWAKSLHLFPNNLIPPLRLPQNFSYAQLTPQALHQIKLSTSKLKHISDLLYVRKVPEINHGTFPKEALDLFNDSQLQQILNENTDQEYCKLAETLD